MVLSQVIQFYLGLRKWKIAIALTGSFLVIDTGVQAGMISMPQLAAQQADFSIYQTTTGHIGLHSSPINDDKHYNLHVVEGVAEETLIIDLVSDDFDAYLTLISPNGERIAWNNYGGKGTNARIIVILPMTGSYTIMVSSYESGGAGEYQLNFGIPNSTQHELNLAVQFTEQAFDLYQLNIYEETEPLLQQALAIRQARLGSNHPLIGESLDNLASFYLFMQRFEEAEPMLVNVIGIYNANSDLLSMATSLYNLGMLHEHTGRYREAEYLLKQALEIREQELGSNHPDVIWVRNSLASVAVRMGGYRNAILQYTQIFNAQYNLLAHSLGSQDNSIYQLFIKAIEQILPTSEDLAANHSEISEEELKIAEEFFVFMESLNEYEWNFLLNQVARNDQTVQDILELIRDPVSQEILASLETQLGYSIADFMATNLANVASLALSSGFYNDQDHDLLELFYKISLTIRETKWGAEHLLTAESLRSLAGLYSSISRYEDAESFYERAIVIQKEQLGDQHPFTAVSLNGLAFVYELTDRHEEAELLYKQAFNVFETKFGLAHPSTIGVLNNLAVLYQAQENFQYALDSLNQALAGQEDAIIRNLVGGSDESRRDYMATLATTPNIAISAHLGGLPDSSNAAQLAFSSILQRKGRILDLNANFRSLFEYDIAFINLIDDLNNAYAKLANTIYDIRLGELDQAQLLDKTQNDILNLESELGRRSAEFVSLTTTPTIEEFQGKLPSNSNFVEFIRYRPLNPKASFQKRYEPEHYAVYVLSSDGRIQGLDLGPANVIDDKVVTLIASLSSAGTSPNEVRENAQALYKLAVAPVREALGDTTTIFIAPEGALNLIPFEALVDESGRYLVETYEFRYLTSGRDLVRLDNVEPSTNPPVLVGNPTYGRSRESVAQGDTRPVDLRNNIFTPLPGTKDEIELIAPLLPGAEPYSGSNATEALIKAQQRPSILHIATHGFFEPVEETINPLLNSGLILAGAATGQSGPDEDGILTALEVTGLNLRGTQLVVLSACETGRGELAAGEGVYGLRRALVLAGSQSQVISLWKVDDTATQEWMVAYYSRLLDGVPRAQALRDTQRAFLEHPDYSHPYYWAAFIGSGDWRPLQLGQ